MTTPTNKTETCGRCKGSGMTRFTHVQGKAISGAQVGGVCFDCKGAGTVASGARSASDARDAAIKARALAAYAADAKACCEACGERVPAPYVSVVQVRTYGRTSTAVLCYGCE